MNVLNFVFNGLVPAEGGHYLSTVPVTAGAGWLNAGKEPILKLFKNDVPITPGMALADLEECDFSGYAEVITAGWLATYGPNGVPMITMDAGQFVGGNPLTVPGQAVGVYLTDWDETVILAIERFPEIFAIDEVADEINIFPQLQFPGWAASQSP